MCAERSNTAPAPSLRLAQAVECWQSGRRSAAEALCRAAVHEDPFQPDGYRLLAEILAATNREGEAIGVCRRVAELAPGDAANLRRLSGLLSQTGDAMGAAALLERSLAIEPQNPRALNNLGNLLIGMNRAADAVPLLERALRAQPAYPIAFNNLGIAFSRLGEHDKAIASYERALALTPGFSQASTNLANALAAAGLAAVHRGQATRALTVFDHALTLEPTLAKAHAGRGLALAAAGRGTEAVEAYARAAELDPRDVSVFQEVGALLLRLGRTANAHAAFSAALELQPDHVLAQEGCVMSLIALNRYEEAAPGLAALRVAAPWIAYLQGHEFHARLECCDWMGFEATHRELTERVRRGELAESPLSFLAHSESAADQRRCAETYVADKYAIRAAAAPRPRHSSPRLRIGYLSADLRNHPVAQLLAGVWESRDRSQFETYALSAAPDDGSELRTRLERAFDHFVDVTAMQDAALASHIADLQIDILVDLGGHTAGNRTRVLGYRPAPVQLAFLGYPGTVGAPFIDYIVADRHVIPAAEAIHYAEQVIYLPDSYLPTDFAGPPAVTPTPAEAGLPPGFIYCSFNAPYKISPSVFDSWMRILTAAPGSVLWLRDMPAAAKSNLARECMARSVNPARLVHAPPTPTLAEHRARLSLADLFLDTQPYNAHTTASDALGAGVPVLTLRGNTFASRVATSLLHAVDLGRLSVDSAEEYERIAVGLARAPDELAELKAHLRRVRATAPLFDTVRFCRHLEAAYREIWQRHLRGEKPSTLRVQHRVS